MALEGDVVLGDAERLAGGDAELELDEVDALAALVGPTRTTSSVTGCSTWRRVFISRKKNSPVALSSRNSTVPAPV